MMTTRDSRLYHQVVEVTEDYLGPAAQRFIDRQIMNHLHKSPAALTQRDLPLLIEWIHAAVVLITEDTNLINDFVSRLEGLTKKQPTI